MSAEIERFLLGREQLGMRFGLARMRRLLAGLGDPQDSFAAVHVVGTNGKSSTTLMIAAVLEAQGIASGSFTSPHLLTFRERIELGGRMISEENFADCGAAVKLAVERDDVAAEPDDRVTQFEAITAIAFCAFVRAGVDVAVVEAGLGGRLDATNVLGDSRVQVLTGVGIDHTEYLGSTLEAIAREKVAVVRSGGVLVSGPLPQVVRPVVNAATDERDANWIELRGVDPAFAFLPGEFVRANATLALAAGDAALGRLRPGVWFDTPRALDALRDFAASEHQRGRLQIANHAPLEIRDVAHNAQAAAALVEAVSELAGELPVTLLVAMLSGKPVDETLAELIRMLPAEGALVCTSVANPRALSAQALAEHARRLVADSVRVESIESPIAALGRAREIAGQGGLLCVTGSNYLVGDLMRGPDAGAGASL